MSELRDAAVLALAHVQELEDAWARGRISEHDGKGGERSNRNVQVRIALDRALVEGATCDGSGWLAVNHTHPEGGECRECTGVPCNDGAGCPACRVEGDD